MSRANALLIYDGPALREGTMDVRDLAPALLSFGELVEQTNKELNEGSATVSVRVRSDFRTGSFNIDLEVIQNVIQDVGAFIGVFHLATAGTLLDRITNVIKIIQFLRGQPPKNETIINAPQITIVNVDGDQNSVSADTYKLYRNKAFRRALREVVEPLEVPGIDRIEIRAPDQTAEVAREQLPFFEVEEEREEEAGNISRQTLRVKILRVVWEKDKKWLLFDGERKFYACIVDDRFWNRVDEHRESFMKGDELVVDLESQQVVSGEGRLTWRHEITRVIKHDRATDQQLIPFPEEGADYRGEEG